MRIALISPFTLPFYCGNSILAERLRQGLIERNYQVAVFNSVHDDPAKAAGYSPHIIHSFNAERPYEWMRELRKQYITPWVITLTGTDYNSWSGAKEPPSRIRESLEQADALVVFHDEALQILCGSMPQLKGKAHVIPQGVTLSRQEAAPRLVREKYGLNPDDVVFLTVCGIRPVKNLPCAIEAFFEVEQVVPHVRLLHVGPIMDKEEAERVRSLGKSLRCFRLLGELPPSGVRELMGAADVFLNTSLNEGMAGAILEAMAGGLPILASAVAGNRSLVQDGVNGLLFSPENYQPMREAAITLALNDSLRTALGGRNKSIIAKHHTPEKELDGHEHIYRLLSQKARKAPEPAV